MKLTGKLEEDTPIAVLAVSGAVANEVWQHLHKGGYDHPGAMVHGLSEYLATYAEQCYKRNVNKRWGKLIRSEANNGRKGLDALYLFMRHWAAGWVSKNLGENQSRALPSEFANGVA